MTFAITLTAFCTAVVIVSFLGGILPLAIMLNHTRLQVYLSFSAGTMLGAAFFHMLPEAVRVGSPETVYWSALGLLALFFLERFFSFHRHEAHPTPPFDAHQGHGSGAGYDEHRGDDGRGESHGEVPRRAAGAMRWGPAAIGLAVHSLAGGIALASAVKADFQVGRGVVGAGLGVFVATLVHKPADALTITALMLESGAGRRYAHIINLAFALMIPAGVILFCAGTCGVLPISAGSWTAAALAFSAGTFLCIALSDLLPELHFHSHDRLKLSAALLAGFGLMAGVALLEPSGHHGPESPHPGHLSATP